MSKKDLKKSAEALDDNALESVSGGAGAIQNADGTWSATVAPYFGPAAAARDGGAKFRKWYFDGEKDEVISGKTFKTEAEAKRYAQGIERYYD